MSRKKGIPSGVLFSCFMLAGFIFLWSSQKLTDRFQFAFARIFRWPLTVSREIWLFRPPLVVWRQRSLTDVVSRGQYNRLRNHLANVIEWLKQEREKVQKLSGLRDRPAWKGVNFVLAEVITFSGESCNKLIINRGRNDGLAKGQFVMSDESIIGRICDVDSRAARVKLITDPTSKIAVKIAGCGAGRIMQGSGNCSAKIRFLPVEHKIKVGDVVYACKAPGFLDTPVIVGTVVQCRKDEENPLVWDIIVKPACDIKTVNEVAVIVMNPQGQRDKIAIFPAGRWFVQSNGGI